MDNKIQKAFNEQLKNELYSAYLYLSMAAYFDSINLKGFSHWMKVQVKEEEQHAMKFFDFLNLGGARVLLQAIPQPPTSFSSPKDVFEKTLAHEQKVTGLINQLCKLSSELKDDAASTFLQWFVKEQVEEEESATVILEKFKLLKDESAGLSAPDSELAKRK